MQLITMKTTILVAWLVVMSGLSLGMGVASWPGWVIVAVLTAAPPLAVLWFWREPALTLSQSISEARQGERSMTP